MKTKRQILMDIILTSAAKPQGFCAPDAGVDRKYAGKIARDLVDLGSLFCFQPSQNVKAAYFRTKKARNDYAAEALALNSKPHQHLANPVPQPKESPLDMVVRLSALPAPAEVKRWPGLVYPPGFKASIKPASYTPLNPAKDCALAPARRAVSCKSGAEA